MRLKLAAIVWFAVTFENVYDAIAPFDTPSTSTSAIVWHASGEIVNDWFAPQPTDTAPLGEIVPPAPADAVIVKVLSENVAEIVCVVWTFVNVYVVSAPRDVPSTTTSATE